LTDRPRIQKLSVKHNHVLEQTGRGHVEGDGTKEHWKYSVSLVFQINVGL